MKNTPLRFYLSLTATLLAAPLIGLAQQPQQATLYKQAAQSYYNAAAQDPANASCDKAWGDYYNCLADQLVSSAATVTCIPPNCQPGSGQSAPSFTHSVNGQPVTQSQFDNAVQQSLVPVPVIQSPLANPGNNNNAAEAVGNAVNTIANVLEQQERDREQRAEDRANERAKIAASSGDFVDEIKAMRADVDYPQFLSDYASANNGAGFNTDPEQLTNPSLGDGDRTRIDETLTAECSDFDLWKDAPIPTDGIPPYGTNLPIYEVISQIDAILSIHIYKDSTLDPAVDGTRSAQVDMINDVGICFTQAIDVPASSSMANGGKYARTGRTARTDSIAWSNCDITQVTITPGQIIEGHRHANYSDCWYAIKIAAKGLTAYHTELRESWRDDFNAPPECQFSGEPQVPTRERKTSGMGFVLDSKVAAEHLVALVGRAEQLARAADLGNALSTSPASRQTGVSQAYPASVATH